MAKSVDGVCKLCGKHKKLTFEHLPPEAAFNATSVREYSGDVIIDLMTGADGRMPWDFEGLKWKQNQRGAGGYLLCDECNNNTGSWYMNESAEQFV